jgi:1,4-dihydroxy-2-naphthoate octaprenyltransferase
VRRFGDLVYRRLRLRNPWNYKAPLLISLCYLAIALGRAPGDQALLGILASLCTIAGIAGVAYFINDLGDVRADLLAGKDNAVAGMNWRERALTLTVFLAAALGPWFYLPFTRTSAILLAAEFGLFVIYCFPPFRLKERGFLGVIADAAYAHTLPAVLAVLTFAYLASEPIADLPALLLAIAGWQLALGMRNIVLHQLQDHDADVAGGNRTLAVTLGPERLATILKTVLVPLEIAGFAGFALAVSQSMPWLVPAYGAYVLFAAARLKLLRQPLPSTLRQGLYTYADNFYADWLPLLILGYLLTQVPACWPIAVLHVTLLRNGLRQSMQDLRGRFLMPTRG